ncbi:MAG: oligosaccharide repeat unit polymerase [Fusobacteriaceae bacterium]|nr:oligosaccharide repeat unit polymerase [Fusobacteriaceae bacterium]
MSLRLPNMISWIFYVDLILFNFIGSLLVIYKIDNHYALGNLSDHARIMGFFSIMYVMIVLPLGMIMTNSIFGYKHTSFLLLNYIDKKISNKNNTNNLVKWFLLFLSVISILSVIYVFKVIGSISLFHLFEDSRSDLLVLRISSNREFSGNEYIKNILALALTPFLSYVAYCYKLLNNKSFNKIWFYTLFCFSILIVTYNIEKTPVLFYLLGFLFIRIYIKGRLPVKYIIFTILALLFGLIAMYYLTSDKTGLDSEILFKTILNRLILSQSAGVYLSFDIFPEIHSFLGLSSLSQKVSAILDIEYIEKSSRIIMEYINPEGIIRGQAGTANSLFISEAWSNFGFLGLLISPIYVGIIIQCLYLFLLRIPKNPYWIALMSLYSMKSALTTGAFNYYIYNVTFIVFILISLIVCLIPFFYNKISENEHRNYFKLKNRQNTLC